ncbi:hypothetical protein [Micromonospora ureilytica]
MSLLVKTPRNRWYLVLLIAIATSIAAGFLLSGLRHILFDWYVLLNAGH